MAVVVWLFAGGGHSELKLPLFLERHFPCRFERKMPVRPRSPLPGPAGERRPLPKSGMGHTGKSLQNALPGRLQASLDHESPPALILVVDDLDCHDREEAEQALQKAVRLVPGAGDLPLVIAFAVPEIESWLLADWDHTFGKHTKFRASSEQMRHHLSETGKVHFAQPETFSVYDPEKDSCQEKLSEMIEEAYRDSHDRGHFSKADDTSALLTMLDPHRVSGKCPQFRLFWSDLRRHCIPLPVLFRRDDDLP